MRRKRLQPKRVKRAVTRFQRKNNTFPMQTVKNVPMDAKRKIAMNSSGMMVKRMKLKLTRSITDVTRVKKNDKLNSVKLLMSSEIR